MINKFYLFNRPLRRILRRIIKVGGGRLYSDYKGTVKINLKDSIIINIFGVYYIPYLSANLLSDRKIYKVGLNGSFNQRIFKIKDYLNKTIIYAIYSGGIYIIDWVGKKLFKYTNQAHISV